MCDKWLNTIYPSIFGYYNERILNFLLTLTRINCLNKVSQETSDFSLRDVNRKRDTIRIGSVELKYTYFFLISMRLNINNDLVTVEADCSILSRISIIPVMAHQ